MNKPPLLQAEALTRHYQISRGPFREPALLKALDIDVMTAWLTVGNAPVGMIV